jgi:hypothetical protein
MTDERRPIRQNSGNLKKFQASRNRSQDRLDSSCWGPRALPNARGDSLGELPEENIKAFKLLPCSELNKKKPAKLLAKVDEMTRVVHFCMLSFFMLSAAILSDMT